MNAVAAYLSLNHERLELERFGVPPRPTCILLTPRFRLSRHVVVLVLAAGSRDPVLVAKLPRLPGDDAALRAEAEALRTVERALDPEDVGTTPRLLAFEERSAHPLLLETALLGRPLSPAVVRRDRDGAVASVAGWLERLAVSSATAPTGDAWFERLVVAPLRELAAAGGSGAEVRTMVARTLELAQPLRSAALPLVLEHGDLGHPNVLRQADGRLGILDWERGDALGLPGHDLFFFLAYAAMASPAEDGDSGRLAGVRTAFFGPRAWAWPVVEGYAARVGLDPTLLGPLLAVCSARAVAAVGAPGPSARAANARDAAARHMLLWRHALEEQPPTNAHEALSTTTEGL